MKITFLGAGSTVFVRRIIGDCMLSDFLKNAEFALYDIDHARLQESEVILNAMKSATGSRGTIRLYHGVEHRKDALRGADFVINAVQIGGFEPCTVIDFEIPKKYGLRQTIADTLGIGGIMRALRTIPVLEDFAADMEAVCPNALLLNYTNPMAMISGYLQRYTAVNTLGLCHSVQVCSKKLLINLGLEEYLEGRTELIAGINHMAWLLELRDRDGNDLYPLIRRKIPAKMADPEFKDKIRLDYILNFGYYCTESSEHNAEYNPFYIKSKYPELIQRFNIPLDEYPRRCINQREKWQKEYKTLLETGIKEHEQSKEYARGIMDALVGGTPYRIGGNVLNRDRLITNLPEDACVEVPCDIDTKGVHPRHVGALPTVCAAMNMTNINVQLLTIEAARTKKKDAIYQAAMLDPHTAAELDIDSIKAMVDELIEAHGFYLPKYH